MEIIRTIKQMQQISTQLKKEYKQIGYVATMGYFHEGHHNLMRRARNENDIVITSIFVNPLQFGPNEDFEKYPRDEEKDSQEAEKDGIDYLFLPSVDEMYPNKSIINMHIDGRVDVLCGKSRPGHFNGVLTVLTKLFHIIQPDKTYFGLKDAQQVAVVDALIQEHNFPIELIGVPTTRESDGLAKSSRNVFLNRQEREEAVWLYKSLLHGKQLVVDGVKNPDIIIKEVRELLREHVTGEVDYIEMLSYPELMPIIDVDQNTILAAAVYFKEARIIDNIIFNSDGQIKELIN
ncbi:pantoate--beta-alanine ligase [Oceanobacillus rekensis]|uniref:pantoate--beta-alanine ligase n=1 Tax=Oceanobacillus rekensis TaxID=937927 RepID=UPI000B43FA55|nr:pantoate--beta-alanine ligase [Oceanobacillus rekensis]